MTLAAALRTPNSSSQLPCRACRKAQGGSCVPNLLVRCPLSTSRPSRPTAGNLGLLYEYTPRCSRHFSCGARGVLLLYDKIVHYECTSVFYPRSAASYDGHGPAVILYSLRCPILLSNASISATTLMVESSSTRDLRFELRCRFLVLIARGLRCDGPVRGDGGITNLAEASILGECRSPLQASTS